MKKTNQAIKSDLPKIGAPATRALANVGIKSLKDITRFSEKELLALHGVGPKAIFVLRPILKSHGLSFKGI